MRPVEFTREPAPPARQSDRGALVMTGCWPGEVSDRDDAWAKVQRRQRVFGPHCGGSSLSRILSSATGPAPHRRPGMAEYTSGGYFARLHEGRRGRRRCITPTKGLRRSTLRNSGPALGMADDTGGSTLHPALSPRHGRSPATGLSSPRPQNCSASSRVQRLLRARTEALRESVTRQAGEFCKARGTRRRA